MQGASFLFRFVALSLVFLICFENANGLSCYKCAELHKDLQVLSGARPENMCPNRIRQGLTSTCPQTKPYCLKVLGSVLNGKQADFRLCGEESYKWVMRGRKCIPLAEIPYFSITIGPQKFKPDNGTLCVCNHDKCNL